MTDTSLLQGEINENPITAGNELDVEGLLKRFLAALLEEQRILADKAMENA